MLDVLIIGAGPTGLVLALWLHRQGVRLRIIDKAAGPGTASRALAVHARTLEYYAMLGIAEEIIEAGRRFDVLNYWAMGRHAARVPVGEIGKGLSPFPYALILPQDEHERLLLGRLKTLGVTVEYGTELVGFDQRPGWIEAEMNGPRGEESVEARFLCGCDGAHSLVREALGIAFEGGSYRDLFYVADVVASGPAVNGELHVFMGGTRFNAVFPMKRDGHVRLVGLVPKRLRARPNPRFEDCAADIVDDARLAISAVNWFSTYHVHHRVAESFRLGRAFLLGDAGHIHSPAGGQGMNTGIGDAVNLAWKLAEVIMTQASPVLLESYEDERIGFARTLVASTDRGFTLAVSKGLLARAVRLRLLPLIAPTLFRLKRVRLRVFRMLSQIGISYRGLAPNQGRTEKLVAGDRLPWLAGDEGIGNFAPLKALSWQVHVYGAASAALQSFCKERTLFLYESPWQDAYAASGLQRDGLYLVRPDGHIGFANPAQDVDALGRYLDVLHIRAKPESTQNGRWRYG
jgi:2-polyprenyl-6-methoxyphenol hydroxylase-like FAD-dependent oxidoreductase